MESLDDSELEKEIKILETIMSSVTVPPDAYHETQAEENTCFRHATNMYFQKKYLDENFEATYSRLMKVNNPVFILFPLLLVADVADFLISSITASKRRC